MKVVILSGGLGTRLLLDSNLFGNLGTNTLGSGSQPRSRIWLLL
ncbi:MAG: hypothetical protein PHQ40_02925 [Anaerolineaceae bacterium]|nr:hypothetical protein [Anaerolineaceae bacterium]